MQDYLINVGQLQANSRLDLFLFAFAKENSLGLSRTHIQKLIKQGMVLLNDSSQIVAHHKLKAGDTVKMSVAQKEEKVLEPENIPLGIIYEDDDLAVIIKPIGLVTHPAPGNYSHTLVNALLYRFKNLSDVNPQRPGIVHRLDKDTSGLMVVAKNNVSHLNLTEQFSEHSIKRKYVAVVNGEMEFDEHVIEVPIGRHPFKRKNMAVGFAKNAKYAKTLYRTLKRGSQYSLLELEPFTGRTHQLRVHLAFLGHPILGDTKYAKHSPFTRLALHAKSIGFTHPRTGKFIEFSSPVPPEFMKLFQG